MPSKGTHQLEQSTDISINPIRKVFTKISLGTCRPLQLGRIAFWNVVLVFVPVVLVHVVPVLVLVCSQVRAD